MSQYEVKKEKQRILSFEYIRLFFMIAVVFTHFAFLVEPANDPLSLWISSGSGKDAVSFFFILSGFFMYHTLQKSAYCSWMTAVKSIFKKNRKYFVYYVLRVLLVLVYFLILYFYSGIRDKSLPEILQQAVLSITFLNNYMPGFATDVGWFFESLVFCYVLSYPIYKIICKIERKTQLPMIWMIIVAVYAGIIILFGNHIYGEWITYYCPYIRILDYTAGMIIAALPKELIQKNNDQLATLLEISALVLMLFEHFYIPRNMTSMKYPLYLLMYFVINSYLVFVFSKNAGGISSFLNRYPFILQISRNGFAIYIFHDIILRYSTLIPWSPNKYFNLLATLIVIICADSFFDSFIFSRRKKYVRE